MLHRGDFHQALVDEIQRQDPAALRLNAKCTGFTQSADAVVLHLSNGSTESGDVLIGADGVHSDIRQQMIGDSRAFFTGIAAWRGLVPMNRLPERLRRPVGTNWIGPGGHVITYPVRHAELLNFVGAIERESWPVESWTERGSIAECEADFLGWHDDVKEIVRNIDIPYKWALLGREPLRAFATGRVCLIGDAAHPTLPFLAQGANMAIEDGMVLARCLDAYESPETALQHFEKARLARTTTIVNNSLENAKRFHNPTLGDPAMAAAYVEREWQPDKIKERYDWLFEYDALTVEV
jgi:salicylate hydroxylase